MTLVAIHAVATLFAVACPVAVGEGMTFLANRDEAFTSDLLVGLQLVANRDRFQHTEKRVARLETAMRGMYEALPKNVNDRLDSAAVRYMLHRLFVERHGWFVNGLHAGGGSWNSTAATAMISQHVDDDTEKVFLDRLMSKGFTLHHSAVLAATLESLVHEEALRRLQTAFDSVGIKSSEVLSEQQVDVVMRIYMAMYVMGVPVDHVNRNMLKRFMDNAKKILPIWHDVKKFLHETRATVLENDDQARASPLSRETTLKVMEQVAERFGKWQDRDCRQLKRDLMALEIPGTGRVPLAQFYNGAYHFVESPAYLRQLGSLDESDSSRVSVIVPNYVNGANNCMPATKHYQVCCIDECNALFTHLEQRIAAPSAKPEHLIQLVEGLASDTVPAPRRLNTSMIQKLSEIAAHHGGEVILHGRLFAQWMHFAYPHECNFPHVSGTFEPMSQRAYMAKAGFSAHVASQEQIDHIKAENKGRTDPPTLDEFAMWSSEEELITENPRVRAGFWKTCFLVGSSSLSLVAMAIGLLKSAKGVLDGIQPSGDDSKIYV